MSNEVHEEDDALIGRSDSIEMTLSPVSRGKSFQDALGPIQIQDGDNSKRPFVPQPPSSQMPLSFVSNTSLARKHLLARVGYEDHFTLKAASSNIRFRTTNSISRVYATSGGDQFIMEEDFDDDVDGNHTVHVKHLTEVTTGLRAIRACYTLVCVFFTGFLFVFCLQLLLYLILDLTVQLGQTSIQKNINVPRAMGAILALPVYVYGLANALVLSGHFIVDTWEGHSLMRQFVFGRYNGVLIEWASFFVFLGIPLIVMCLTLLSGSDTWWTTTALVWFGCVVAAYVYFSVVVVYFENQACFSVMRNIDSRGSGTTGFWRVLKRCILLRLKHRYSGKSETVYLAKGSVEKGYGLQRQDSTEEDERLVTVSLYSRFTQLGFLSTNNGLGYFEHLVSPVRLYTIQDVQGVRPFVTANTWSLEKLYCRPYNSRYVAIVRGRDAITRTQLRSSFICAIYGNLLVLVLSTALLVWLGLPGTGVALVVVVLFLFFFLPSFMKTLQIFKMVKHLVIEIKQAEAQQLPVGQDRNASLLGNIAATFTGTSADEEAQDELKSVPSAGLGNETGRAFSGRSAGTTEAVEEAAAPASSTAEPEIEVTPESSASNNLRNRRRSTRIISQEEDCEGIFQVWEVHRINHATEMFCWLMFATEVFFFLLWPATCLYLIGNRVIASLFSSIAIFTALREYLNPAVVLEEVGTLDLVEGSTPQEKWQNQSRLNTIVSNITRSNSKGPWITVLCIFLVAFLGLFGLAITQEADTTSNFQFGYLHDFYYEHKQNLEYPTCTIGMGLEALGGPTTDMADYAFLATVAYRDRSITPHEITEWFGKNETTNESIAVDRQDYVDEYRANQTGESVVSYKLVEFPDHNLGVVMIRGTTNAWDALTDAQLWSAAALFQALRLLLPIGAIWTPILDSMVNLISWLQSETISRVSFYRDTTAFILHLKREGLFKNIQITGHSLGGGLSIISGAQTNTSAVALSGPNARISRKTFNPPLTEEALDTLTFNIIPNRDVVPKLDDRSRLFQEIRCTADLNDPIGCHDGRRSLCEIIYTCGTSANRPALCDCTTEFGYPEPLPKNSNGRSFEEACEAQIKAAKRRQR